MLNKNAVEPTGNWTIQFPCGAPEKSNIKLINCQVHASANQRQAPDHILTAS